MIKFVSFGFGTIGSERVNVNDQRKLCARYFVIFLHCVQCAGCFVELLNMITSTIRIGEMERREQSGSSSAMERGES